MEEIPDVDMPEVVFRHPLSLPEKNAPGAVIRVMVCVMCLAEKAGIRGNETTLMKCQKEKQKKVDFFLFTCIL